VLDRDSCLGSPSCTAVFGKIIHFFAYCCHFVSDFKGSLSSRHLFPFQHSGLFVRAQRHASLLVAAASFNSLDSMPLSDARALILLDSLAWTIPDDDIVTSGEPLQLRALCARFGNDEVATRMRFLSIDVPNDLYSFEAEVDATDEEVDDERDDSRL
jgi:hypothetical protein